MEGDTRTTYIEFFSETHFTIGPTPPIWTVKAEGRELSKVKLIQTGCAFRFYDVLSVMREDEDGEFSLKSAHRRESVWYMYGRRVYSFEEMKKISGDTEMIERATKHEWDKLIFTLTGQWCPYHEGEGYELHLSTLRWASNG